MFSDNLNEQISGVAPEYDESGELIPPKPVEGPWKQVSSAQPAPPAASAPPQPAPQPGKHHSPFSFIFNGVFLTLSC